MEGAKQAAGAGGESEEEAERLTPPAKSPARSEEDECEERSFTYEELALATNDFGQQGQRNVMGSGRYGTVYRARLPDGTTVAVKRLANHK